jgi:hypothetical protein
MQIGRCDYESELQPLSNPPHLDHVTVLDKAIQHKLMQEIPKPKGFDAWADSDDRTPSSRHVNGSSA